MSSQNEPVKPTTFTLAEPEPAASANHASGAPRWVFPTLAGLLALALVVVFWLPGRFEGQSHTPAPEEQTLTENITGSSNGAESAKSQTITEEASPWSDAQMAKLRKEAQDTLAILLDVQFELEEMSVEQWAGEAFEEARALAAQGDLQYRDRQFVEAKMSFEQALSGMEPIAESASLALQEKLELARQAIENGERDTAKAALDIAALIDPANTMLTTLTHRVETLEQLLPLLSQAQELEESGDLAGAENSVQQATALDPEHLRARSELSRIATAHTLARFNQAMSEGYAALGEGQFSAARTSFRQAENLSPGSAEANGALQDLGATETTWRLSNLQNTGQKQEANEQWQQAVESFEKALAIDPNLLFAQQGIKRSRARAQLDKQFRAAIDKPQRLSDKTVAGATAKLLQHAATISPRGPVLENQLATLEVLLKQAGARIQLTLRSDGATEVTLRKVSRLGQFQQKTLTVRPGTYTAIGSRDGYRDIRRSFTIDHDSVAFEIEIICTEEI